MHINITYYDLERERLHSSGYSSTTFAYKTILYSSYSQTGQRNESFFDNICIYDWRVTSFEK